MTKDRDTLIAQAKKKLTAIGNIFRNRDGKTDYEVLAYEEDDAITAALKVWTTGDPFDVEMELQLIEATLDLAGGFDYASHLLSDDKRTITYYMTYTGGDAVKADYGEVTLADIIKFMKQHPKDFPLGTKTRISLGDFEGNTYHRKVSLQDDDGRLHLAYELNECDD